jgi:hypothetical protein
MACSAGGSFKRLECLAEAVLVAVSEIESDELQQI